MPDIPSIPPLPPPAIRGTDTGKVFSDKTAALLEALSPWRDAINAFAPALVAAAAAANYSAISNTFLTIGPGTHSLTVQDGKMFVPKQFVTIAASPANWMFGEVISYNFASGALVVQVNGGDAHGSGSHSVWIVGLSGPKGALTDGTFGDISISGNGSTVTINNDVVTNAKLANMATARIKGRTSSGAGDPEDLTPAQATALLDIFTASLKGLVPGGSGGSTSVYLRGDGAWGSPSADASAWTQIGAEIVATGSGPWAFTSIPDVYSDLLLVYVARANTSPGQLNVSLGTGGSYGTATEVFSGNFSGSGSERHGSLYVPAYNYDRGTWLLGGNIATSPSQSGGMMTGSNSAMAGGGWTVSGGVDSIRVSVGGVTLVAPSSFKLFGR